MHITSGQKLDTALRHTTLMMCDAKLRPSPLIFKNSIWLQAKKDYAWRNCHECYITLPYRADFSLFGQINQKRQRPFPQSGLNWLSLLFEVQTLLKYRIYFGDFQRHKMSSITSLPSFSGSHLVQYEKSVCGTISFKLRKNKKESRVNALYLQRLRVFFIF